MTRPGTLTRDVSPPPLRKASTATRPHEDKRESNNVSEDPAAIEAGEAEIHDHLEYFAKHLAAHSRITPGCPRISLEHFRELYQRNEHGRGAHFVVHQHDHPISGIAGLCGLEIKTMSLIEGVHYDLRLQFSESSSVSFAVPYGLPGNPNSTRPNRMAIETRVHNLWKNNLIESASHATGSLLVWDTGEYEVLPRLVERREKTTDDELSDEHIQHTGKDRSSQSEKLIRAFQSRHIRLRLHGSRLPHDYTVSLRLPSANDKSAQPKKPKRKRKRLDPSLRQKLSEFLTDSEPDDITLDGDQVGNGAEEDVSAAVASENEEDATIRANNAYTGATNTIGSIHQRHWFLTLDRPSSGFRKARNGSEAGQWVGTWEPFFVRGRDHERSVVTGRTSDDVLEDAGVQKFIGRKMWRPIVE